MLFLSGHGKFHNEPHTDEAPYGEFLFESEIGDGEPVQEDELAKALVGTRVQVLILSACESGKAASESLSNGLMQKINAQGIPHVIGIRGTIFNTQESNLQKRCAMNWRDRNELMLRYKPHKNCHPNSIEGYLAFGYH